MGMEMACQEKEGMMRAGGGRLGSEEQRRSEG